MYSSTRLARLEEVLRRARKPDYSDFYERLYTGRTMPDRILSQADWERIPLMTRDDLAAAPLQQRLFVQKDEAPLILSTSGTTGRGVVFLPRRLIRTGPRLFPRATIALGFRAAFEAGEFAENPRTIYAEASRLPLAAVLAAKEGVDAIDGAATVLIEFARHFSRIADCGNIRFVALHNDRCTALQFLALKRSFPNARIENWMSLTEFTGYIAFSPEHIPEAHPLALTPHEEVHLEIVDEVGRMVKPGEVGDLVVTSLAPTHASLLVRYKGDDRARLIALDESLMFETVGRAQEERVKIPRGEINVQALDAAIMALNKSDVTDFEAVISEVEQEGRILTDLTISLFSGLTLTDDILTECAERIAALLPVNQERTYLDGISFGLYAPIRCIRGEGLQKRVRLKDVR